MGQKIDISLASHNGGSLQISLGSLQFANKAKPYYHYKAFWAKICTNWGCWIKVNITITSDLRISEVFFCCAPHNAWPVLVVKSSH